MLGSGKSAGSSPREQRRRGAEKTMDPISRLGKLQTFKTHFCGKFTGCSSLTQKYKQTPYCYYKDLNMSILQC